MLVYWRGKTNQKMGEDEQGNSFYNTIEMFGEIVGAMDGTGGSADQKLVIATPDGKFIEMPIYRCYHKNRVLDHLTHPSGRLYANIVQNDDDIYTVEEWKEAVDEGSFNTFDGSGYWVKNGMRCSDEVFSTEQLDATHVVWFNK